LYWYAVD